VAVVGAGWWLPYQDTFTLPQTFIVRPFTAAKLARFLSECDPSPLESSCQLGVDSWFYPKLQAAAQRWFRKPR